MTVDMPLLADVVQTITKKQNIKTQRGEGAQLYAVLTMNINNVEYQCVCAGNLPLCCACLKSKLLNYPDFSPQVMSENGDRFLWFLKNYPISLHKQ